VVYATLCEGDAQLTPEASLVETALRIPGGSGSQTIRGTGVTVSAVCAAPEDKYRLGERHAADAVDMESYTVGQVALEKKCPFLTVRVVLDDAKDDLRILDDLAPGGKIAAFSFLTHLVAHPSATIKLIGLSLKSGKATKRLGTYLSRLVESMARNE
jgi:adenosylhomocysteine nucleosidase